MKCFPANLSLSHHGLCTHSTSCFTECEIFQQLQDRFCHHSKAFLSQRGMRWIRSFCKLEQKHTSREKKWSKQHLSRNTNSKNNHTKNVFEENLMKLNCCTAANSVTANQSWLQLGHPACVIKQSNSVYRSAFTQWKKGNRRTACFWKHLQLGKLAWLTELNYVMTREKILLSEPLRLLNTACSQILHEPWRADLYMDLKSSISIWQRS